jgi:asparagine synthase (glutamine-hydrolysing)
MGIESTISDILTLCHLLRFFGLKWVLFRILYAGKKWLGLFKLQHPIASWNARPLKHFLKEPALADPEVYLRYRRENYPVFLFEPGQQDQFAPFFSTWDENDENLLSYCEQIQQGKLCYFNHKVVNIGFPPAWHINPFAKLQIPSDRHWSKIRDFDNGDIKAVWESNRFGFVYTLVRAYWRTRDDLYAELFWQLIESWRDQNPPQQGSNWKCGQEISFRIMAWCFGLYGFLYSKATTAERVASLAQMIACFGKRIEANISYAISQLNNHGISEGMGLWTIGILFPEFRFAEKWEKLGRQILEVLGLDLIYEDGSFVQHSINYQRIMMQDYLWSLRLGDLHNKPFSIELKKRLGKSAAFLYQIQDKESGRIPNYGQNDGVLVLPLSNCDYQDFRPVVQTTYYLVTGNCCFPAGPWNEELLWLFGQKSLDAPVISPEKENLKADIGGYYTLRSSNGFIFTRCATFRHRPSHADMLNVDLWWQGQNIALDPGTYSYNAEAPWENPLAQTAYHNTVTVDELDQMRRVSKFLWLPWICSQVHCYQQSSGKQLAYWEGEHNGYWRLKPAVHHRRGILQLGTDHWLVLDALSSRRKHKYRLHWLFPDISYIWDEKEGFLKLQTRVGTYYVRMAMLSGNGLYSFVRADKHCPRGWKSPYYFYREPALSVDLITVDENTFFWTLFGPENCTVTYKQNILQIESAFWSALIKIQPQTDMPLIRFSSLKGISDDRLEIPQ